MTRIKTDVNKRNDENFSLFLIVIIKTRLNQPKVTLMISNVCSSIYRNNDNFLNREKHDYFMLYFPIKKQMDYNLVIFRNSD